MEPKQEYKLVFECCGNEIRLGYDTHAGSHGKHCLACDTENPDTSVEKLMQ